MSFVCWKCIQLLFIVQCWQLKKVRALSASLLSPYFGFASSAKLVQTGRPRQNKEVCVLNAVNSIEEINDWFCGLYNNTQQYDDDNARNKTTTATGQHELCSVAIYPSPHPAPTDQNVLIASYRYGLANNTIPFRFRLYKLLPPEESDPKYVCTMKLYKPNFDTEKQLEKVNYDLFKYVPSIKDCEEIKGCLIGWRKRKDGLFGLFGREYYYGVLTTGSIKLPSSKLPNVTIIVTDELRVYRDEVWVNDRVVSTTGELFYGNVDNIPYKFNKHIFSEYLPNLCIIQR